MSDWVRVTIIGPDTQTVDSQDIEDPWYRAGGHRHPDEQQRARDELAAEELREWLRRRDPASGVYVVWVAQLDLASGLTSRTWANVKINHTSSGQAVA